MGDGLNNINPDDIESIQVLKGAAASALYGYRGGNGAILITTKSGKKGKPVSVEFNNNLTFNTIYDQRDFQTTFGQGSNGKRPMDAQAAKDSETSNWGEYMDEPLDPDAVEETTPEERNLAKIFGKKV